MFVLPFVSHCKGLHSITETNNYLPLVCRLHAETNGLRVLPKSNKQTNKLEL